MTAKIKLNAASGGGSVSLQAPTSTTNNENIELKLPVADGTSGQALTTNASGQLAFATISSNPTTTSGTDNFTVADGNLVIGTSGHGIDFSATSGTGSSELFDDYEEGTYTPGAMDGNNYNITLTVSSDANLYTKVGRLVHISGKITLNDTGKSGEVVLTGLPFAATNEDQGACGQWWMDKGGSSVDTVGGVIRKTPSSTIAYFVNPTGGASGGGNADDRYFQFDDWQNGKHIMFGFTYITAG